MTTNHNVDNIKAVYQLATAAEVAAGKAWYPAAYEAAKIIASRYGIHTHEVAAVISSLSPRNRWERNLQDAEALAAAYALGGAKQAEQVKVCSFNANKVKAIRILGAGCITDADLLTILKGPKLSEFFCNIIGNTQEVTIDGHAWCIHQNQRLNLADVPNITKKARATIKDDYRQAAAELGIEPSELQAATWLTWRRIHGITK